MFEIKSAGVILDVPKHHSPEFHVRASFDGRTVRQAFAAVSSFSFVFGNGDHHIEGLGVQIIDTAVAGDSVLVTGQASFHDSGGNDDPYHARLTFLIFADVD